MKSSYSSSKCPLILHPAIRPILIGVLGFVVVNLLFTAGVTLSPLNKKFNFSYGNFLPAKLETLREHQPETVNVLALGTSQTNNGFVPSRFEKASGQVAINSFNVGLPNNRYDIMLAYLQFHQKRYGKPKLLLVEVSPSIQEKDAHLYYLPALYYRTLIEQAPTLAPKYLSNPLLADNVRKELFYSSLSSLHQYRFTFSPMNLIGKVGDKLGGKLHLLANRLGASAQATEVQPKNTPYVESISDAAEPEKAKEKAKANAKNNVTPKNTEVAKVAAAAQPESAAKAEPLPEPEKGWYPKEQSPNMTTPEGVRLSVEEARKYYIEPQKEVHFDKLRMLLAYCREQNIPVVLVSWPNHPAFLKEFSASSLNRSYQQGLQQLLAEEKVPMVNLNHEIPSSQKENEGGLFSDPRHLTPEGAQLFSGLLAHRVFDLPLAQKIGQKQFAP